MSKSRELWHRHYVNNHPHQLVAMAVVKAHLHKYKHYDSHKELIDNILKRRQRMEIPIMLQVAGIVLLLGGIAYILSIEDEEDDES